MSKYNKLLKKVELFEKLAVYGDRSSFLKAIAQGVSYPGDIKDMWGQDPDAGAGTGDAPVVFKDDHITGYAPIDRQQQRAAFQFVLDENLDPDKKILPTGQIEEKDIDGRLGKQTRAALEAVKNYFAKVNPQNKRMTDQEALVAARTPSSKSQVAKATPPQRNPGDPLPPMGPGLQGVVTNTRSSGIGEHAGNVPRPNVTPPKT